MAIDPKIIIGIVIAIVLIATILYFILRKPKSQAEKEIEYELNRLKSAQDEVKRNLGLIKVNEIKAQCKSVNDQGYINAYKTFDDAFKALNTLYTEKKSLIPPELATKCDDAIKNAAAFNLYLKDLVTCQELCEKNGTATLVGKECQCKQGYTNPVADAKGYVTCSATQATGQVQTALSTYDGSEKGLSDFLNQFKMDSKASQGCIIWAGGYDTEEKRKKANTEC